MESNRLGSIIRHIKKVEDNCNLLARKFIETSNVQFGLKLIQRGRMHDLSKFDEFEFENLFDDSIKFKEALELHRKLNRHHPEFHENGIHGMDDLDVAEMVCDCLARSQEFGSDIKKWFFGSEINDAPAKYNYNINDSVWVKIEFYLSLLLTPSFNTMKKEKLIDKKVNKPKTKKTEKGRNYNDWPLEPWETAGRGGFDDHKSVYGSYTDKK